VVGNAGKNALVTGASSGLGFEAAAQLAEKGFGTVIITARRVGDAEEARTRLTERTGKDVFAVVALDNGDLDSVEAAAATMADHGAQLDYLLLNAGIASPKNISRTSAGIELTVAATLIGHHLLTMRLLERGLLSQNGRIVIAGSEAARGDVPTMTPLDVDGFASAHFDGDLEAAIERQIRMEPPANYKPNDVYATAKMFVAWWAAELARRLPDGMTVNAVSPGSTPSTGITDGTAAYMRFIMAPLMKLLPGMSHSVADGADRYLQALSYDDEVTGKFFASKPKKMTGPLVEIRMNHIDNEAARKALWATTAKLAHGVSAPPRS
jgi:NAD(P)-dependent dehydrogenase (short-subunit alcohol dehydrogenase family)